MKNKDMSMVRATLQIDEEYKQGWFSDKYLAHYTLMVFNPFHDADISCFVSVKSFYYTDLPGGSRSVSNVDRKVHSNIFIRAGTTESVKGKINFLAKGSLGSRMWVETNGWGRDHPGGVKLESCVFVR